MSSERRPDRCTVAVVGSGVAGSLLAHHLAERGHDVVVFEKGPAYPYPHTPQFNEKILYRHDDPRFSAPPGIRGLTDSGDYRFDLEQERGIVVGGGGSHWEGITPRMVPADFRTRTLYGYGRDWPIDYDTLEPYYGRAERLIGVSGTDEDNPFAPPRSTPYPLPPFAMSWDDRILAERLARNDIVLHSTPQARARLPYDERSACLNYGACHVCPVGARYSSNHHLMRAVATGRCTVLPDVSVRRIVADGGRPGGTVVFQGNDDAEPSELDARVIVVAAGAIESARLLLLSADERHPDGLGNAGGRVGRQFALHHAWWNHLEWREPLFPGRFGGWSAHSLQFLDPPTRGRHGGIKVTFASKQVDLERLVPGTGDEIRAQLESRLHRRPIILAAEPSIGDGKRIELGRRRDRFGDPFAHVEYTLDAFDHETWTFASELNDRFAAGTGAEAAPLHDDPRRFGSGAHHMGGCAMSESVDEGVVDATGRIHGESGVYVAGCAVFPSASGAVNPTLTLAALALRTADVIADQEL